MLKLSFHGAARTVTGSRYLLDADGERLLVDCGMFQGLKRLRELNWQTPSFNPSLLPRVILTHAHIDHSGMLPRLRRLGFKGDIYATPATGEMCRFMLLDAAHLQMEDAAYVNRKRRTKHSPALPLYTTDDVEGIMAFFRAQDYGDWKPLSSRFSFRFVNAGHLLGSAMAQVKVATDEGERTILFSGDIGRYGMPIVPDPSPPPPSDYLVVESTYGDRCHCNEMVADQLAGLAGPCSAAAAS